MLITAVTVAADEYILGRTDTFGFNFMHLPPLNDKNVVLYYTISLRWYQNKDLGYPTNPTIFSNIAYDWKNGTWVSLANSSDFGAFGGKGWKSWSISTYGNNVRPLTNKLGVRINYNDFDKTLGTLTTPYLLIDYTLKVVKIALGSITNKKENEDVVLKWTSDATQTNYEVRYTNDSVTKTLKGTTAQSVTIDKYTLRLGKLEYEVRVSNGYNWSEWTKGNIEILEHPIHLTLEPNKIAQNKDKPIVAMWSTSDIQKQYRLTYKQGNNTDTITGTTNKVHTFPAGFFSNGIVELTLEIFNGYVWTEKIAEFMAYGAPPHPILTTQATYATATPTLTWTANEQVSYKLQILKDDVVVLDSSDVYSGAKNHKFIEVLENNTTYVAKLRIRNQYEIESEWVTKSFAVAFTELQKPYFDMFANDGLGTIMFNIYNAIGQSNFGYCEVLRREYGETPWSRIVTNLPLSATYTDYTCRSGILYEYKVRAIGTNGGYTDSEVELKQITLRNTMISDTTDFDNYVVLIHNPKKNRAFAKETYAMQYSGSRTPSFEFGEVRYVSMSVSFTVDEKTLDKLLNLYYNNNILLLRDNRGKKIYGQISGEPSAIDAEFMKYNVSFNFAETKYVEGVLV